MVLLSAELQEDENEDLAEEDAAAGEEESSKEIGWQVSATERLVSVCSNFVGLSDSSDGWVAPVAFA